MRAPAFRTQFTGPKPAVIPSCGSARPPRPRGRERPVLTVERIDVSALRRLVHHHLVAGLEVAERGCRAVAADGGVACDRERDVLVLQRVFVPSVIVSWSPETDFTTPPSVVTVMKPSRALFGTTASEWIGG